MSRDDSPVRAIRKKCVDCQGGSVKAVRYCPADGVHGRQCSLWRFRFGMRPMTAAQHYGRAMLDPKAMPEANEPVEALP